MRCFPWDLGRVLLRSATLLQVDAMFILYITINQYQRHRQIQRVNIVLLYYFEFPFQNLIARDNLSGTLLVFFSFLKEESPTKAPGHETPRNVIHCISVLLHVDYPYDHDDLTSSLDIAQYCLNWKPLSACISQWYSHGPFGLSFSLSPIFSGSTNLVQRDQSSPDNVFVT